MSFVRPLKTRLGEVGIWDILHSIYVQFVKLYNVYVVKRWSAPAMLRTKLWSVLKMERIENGAHLAMERT